MRTLKPIIPLLTLLIFNSCQFNQSVNTDLSTGAYTRGDGIGCNDVRIEINGKAQNRNEFVYGEKIELVFNNLQGLTNSDNKTYPGLAVHIIKNESDTLESNPDVLNDMENGTDLSPLQLKAYFRTVFPYQNNEKYEVHVNIWDKKGDGNLFYELPFEIKENELLKIEKKNIDYSNIYLWNETLKQPVFDKNVDSEHKFILILEGVEGLELKNDMVFPIFSVKLIDALGNEILSNPNILIDFEAEGVPQKNLKEQVTAILTFPQKEINNPCRLNAKLKDVNSSKEIFISTELQIN